MFKRKSKNFLEKNSALKNRSLLSIEKHADMMMTVSAKLFTASIVAILAIPLGVIIEQAIKGSHSNETWEIINDNFYVIAIVVAIGIFSGVSFKNDGMNAYDFVSEQREIANQSQK